MIVVSNKQRLKVSNVISNFSETAMHSDLEANSSDCESFIFAP